MHKIGLMVLAVFSMLVSTAQAQKKFEVISKGTPKAGNYVVSVNGKKTVGGAHEITRDDLIEITVYKPSETQDARLPKGNSYNAFVISAGATRDPQSILYFNTDKPGWQDALRAAGVFKVTGLGVMPNGQRNSIKPNDYFELRAQQETANGPINITFDVFRLVNGKQISVATFSGNTKPMQWPQ